MKAKDFQIGAGEYAVVATYTNFNDATQETEETTIRTHERPRPRFYTDVATLALRAREYWKLGDLKLVIKKIGFTENDDGRFCRISLETVDGPTIRVQPPRVKRDKYVKPGEDEPDPESPLNIFLDAVDLVENRISEYLRGDREQPELPLVEEVPAPVKQGFFSGIFGGKKQPAAMSMQG